jgi:hypothetical protein
LKHTLHHPLERRLRAFGLFLLVSAASSWTGSKNSKCSKFQVGHASLQRAE